MTPNQQRASYAVEVIANNKRYDDDDTGIQDLFTDLLHLCREKKWDCEEILRMAKANFDAEVMDEEFENEEAA
jgi:hypothetical protein